MCVYMRVRPREKQVSRERERVECVYASMQCHVRLTQFSFSAIWRQRRPNFVNCLWLISNVTRTQRLEETALRYQGCVVGELVASIDSLIFSFLFYRPKRVTSRNRSLVYSWDKLNVRANFNYLLFIRQKHDSHINLFVLYFPVVYIFLTVKSVRNIKGTIIIYLRIEAHVVLKRSISILNCKDGTPPSLSLHHTSINK